MALAAKDGSVALAPNFAVRALALGAEEGAR